MAKPTLIIVEDTQALAEDLRKALEPEFDVVGVVGGGQEAIALSTSLSPMLVLMDLVMPKMSGLEATRQIKILRPQTQVVILTALEDEVLAIQAMEAGACEYLMKPVSMETLKKVLHRFSQTVQAPEPLSPT